MPAEMLSKLYSACNHSSVVPEDTLISTIFSCRLIPQTSKVGFGPWMWLAHGGSGIWQYTPAMAAKGASPGSCCLPHLVYSMCCSKGSTPRVLAPAFACTFPSQYLLITGRCSLWQGLGCKQQPFIKHAKGVHTRIQQHKAFKQKFVILKFKRSRG